MNSVVRTVTLFGNNTCIFLKATPIKCPKTEQKVAFSYKI